MVKKFGILFGILFILIMGLCFFFNGITTSKGVTSISPINVGENGFFCKTKSVTAARSSDSGSFIVSSGGLKYNVLNKDIYRYLEQNIGKTVVVNYEKRSFFFNPCLNSQYIITEYKPK